jgi:hypothetical protein
MTARTETAHRSADFVLSLSGFGNYSFRNTRSAYGFSGNFIVAGEDLVAGMICQEDEDGVIWQLSGGEVAGITFASVAQGGTVCLVACAAEVKGNRLTYPAESTEGGEGAAADAGLLERGIIVRR